MQTTRVNIETLGTSVVYRVSTIYQTQNCPLTNIQDPPHASLEISILLRDIGVFPDLSTSFPCLWYLPSSLIDLSRCHHRVLPSGSGVKRREASRRLYFGFHALGLLHRFPSRFTPSFPVLTYTSPLPSIRRVMKSFVPLYLCESKGSLTVLLYGNSFLVLLIPETSYPTFLQCERDVREKMTTFKNLENVRNKKTIFFIDHRLKENLPFEKPNCFVELSVESTSFPPDFSFPRSFSPPFLLRKKYSYPSFTPFHFLNSSLCSRVFYTPSTPDSSFFLCSYCV